jgi:uncharacterized protein YqgC (DUF456 family)
MSGPEFLLGLLIGVGLIGILVPLLPGTLLVAGVVLAWAVIEQSGTASAFAVVALLLMGAGAVVKYLVPGRRLQQSGVPNGTLLLGAAVAIVGFFVIPVVGLPLGFVLGVYVAEWHRVSRDQAWPATVAALKAIGLGILIELSFTTLAAAVWLVGAIVT